jgi:hypothetical protein
MGVKTYAASLVLRPQSSAFDASIPTSQKKTSGQSWQGGHADRLLHRVALRNLEEVVTYSALAAPIEDFGNHHPKLSF